MPGPAVAVADARRAPRRAPRCVGAALTPGRGLVRRRPDERVRDVDRVGGGDHQPGALGLGERRPRVGAQRRRRRAHDPEPARSRRPTATSSAVCASRATVAGRGRGSCARRPGSAAGGPAAARCPASWPAVSVLGSSTRASGLPAGPRDQCAHHRRRQRRPARRTSRVCAAASVQPAQDERVEAGGLEARPVVGPGRRTATATRSSAQPPRREQQRVAGRGVQPVRVVDDAQHGRRARRRPTAPTGSRARPGTARRPSRSSRPRADAQRARLRGRQARRPGRCTGAAAGAARRRPAAPPTPGPGCAARGTSAAEASDLLEQRRLADPRLAQHDQRAAAAGARVVAAAAASRAALAARGRAAPARRYSDDLALPAVSSTGASGPAGRPHPGQMTGASAPLREHRRPPPAAARSPR